MRFEFIIFDLDDTLYPRDSGVMQEIGRRIQTWLCNHLGLTWEEATTVRRDYLRRYGTTLGGLIAERNIDVSHYLTFVHDVPIEEYLEPSSELAAMLDDIPLRKVIYTNAISEHGWRVLRALDVADRFEQVIGIEDVGLRNKFNSDAYKRVLALLDARGPGCIMVEDSLRNLPPAKALGMTTIFVDAGGSTEPVEARGEYVDFAVDSVLEVGRVAKCLLRRPTSGVCERTRG